MYQEAEQIQTRRRQIDTAIQLAMDNRWEEAVQVNRAIIGLFPNDTDSYNRLGKALMELARYNEAKKAYKKALELDETNQIAKKNLERLNVLAKSKAPQAETTQVNPRLFIEEMGKTAVTTVQQPDINVLAKLNAGERLDLKPQGRALAVVTPGGEPVGTIEPKLGHRLIKLIDGGNQYAAAITSLTKTECKIIIKEVYQHPSQVGRPSFPTAVTAEGLRPYTKDTLLRYSDQAEEAERMAEEQEDDLAAEAPEEAWESDNVIQEGHIRLNDAAAAEDALDEELEE
jgi:tetratricopeptide (TPR) repeat protein